MGCVITPKLLFSIRLRAVVTNLDLILSLPVEIGPRGVNLKTDSSRGNSHVARCRALVFAAFRGSL